LVLYAPTGSSILSNVYQHLRAHTALGSDICEVLANCEDGFNQPETASKVEMI